MVPLIHSPVSPSHLSFAHRTGQPSSEASQKHTASLKQERARTVGWAMRRQGWGRSKAEQASATFGSLGSLGSLSVPVGALPQPPLPSRSCLLTGLCLNGCQLLLPLQLQRLQ